MFDGLFIASIIGSVYQVIKEKLEPTIPAENWANKELYYEDMKNGLSDKQMYKNLKNGKYKLTEVYPEPHRDKDGKIIIENYQLYKQDVRAYGAVQAQRWVKRGKYNLPSNL